MSDNKLSGSVERAAAKRNRKVSEARGNKDRQEVEGKAAAWKNEGTAKSNTPPSGSATVFQPGSYPGGLHFNLRRQGKVV
jgi:hypothetical protein